MPTRVAWKFRRNWQAIRQKRSRRASTGNEDDSKNRCPHCQKFFVTGKRGVSVHLESKVNTDCYNWYHTRAERSPPSSLSPSPTPSPPPTPSTTALSLEDDDVAAPAPAEGLDDFSIDNLSTFEFAEEELHPRSEPRTFDNHTEKYPGAGKAFGVGDTILDDIRKNDDFAGERETNIYYPFASKDDWETGSWLSRLNVPMGLADEFFQLHLVNTHPGPSPVISFHSAKELRSRVELLPSPPRWKSAVIKVPGGTSKDKMVLLYRDGFECFEFVFRNPIFQDNFDVAPMQVFPDAEKKTRIYSEMMTGNWAWEIQGKCPTGETLGLVLLASDKTHLTNSQGDKECHAVYLSCGNIRKAIRTKATSHAWIMIAQIPIVKFEEKKFQGLLTKRLYHVCMEIVVRRLKEHSITAVKICDPSGTLRKVRTVLAGYIADLPEKLMISGNPQNASPVSEASMHQFGDPLSYPPRSGAKTCEALKTLLLSTNPLELQKFASKSKDAGLNGTHMLFWDGWNHADPGSFLVPDALHDWHKFTMDHSVQWIRMLLGDTEVDKRFSVVQRRVSFRHFKNGFTRFRQHTGREQRDITRLLLVTSAGHPSFSPSITRAFRGIIDFIYYGQYESHDDETLEYLSSALQQFHANKDALSRAGVRDGPRRQGLFNIPKLELMHNAERMIRLHGSLQQFSGDQTERLHIANAKVPYRHTNRKDFGPQMCRFLDRNEKIRLFTVYLAWIQDVRRTEQAIARSAATDPASESSEPEADIDSDDEVDGDGADDSDADEIDGQRDITDPQKSSLRQEQFARISSMFLRAGVRDTFLDSTRPQNTTTAFILKREPDAVKVEVDRIAEAYGLSDFRRALNDYYYGYSRAAAQSYGLLPFVSLKIWAYMRLQMRVLQDNELVFPPQTVMAYPPCKDKPYGHCNFVLVRDSADVPAFRAGSSGISGASDDSHFVAQVKCIFKPVYQDERRPSETLVFVQPLKPAPGTIRERVPGEKRQEPDADIDMYRVVRSLRSDNSRRGLIIRLYDIWRPVEVVPRFGKKCPAQWDTYSSVELAKEFYINSFADKETFQNVH